MNFSKTEHNLIISGKTFYAKEAIKSVGGKWDTIKNHWTLPVHIDSLMLRKDLEGKALAFEKAEKTRMREEKKVARAYAISPEGIAEAKKRQHDLILACLEEKKKTGAYHWICCDQCEVVDWQRQHTNCNACAVDCGLYKNSFRVRGSIFTGD